MIASSSMIASPLPRETLLFAAKKLPAAPQILARLGELLRDPDKALDAIIGLLRRDAGLTAHVLRVANSAAYHAGMTFESLEDALPRVGLAEVYRLTGIAAAAQLADRALHFYGISGGRLRENSLFCGLVMEALAWPAQVDSRLAYTAGLLRSTGKIVLDRLMCGSDCRSGYAARGSFALADWETAVVGLSNCEAAEIILDAWHFPGTTIAAIRDHCRPGKMASGLAALLNLAAGAAERSGHALPGERSYWELTPPMFAQAGVDEAELEIATRRARDNFEPLRIALG